MSAKKAKKVDRIPREGKRYVAARGSTLSDEDAAVIGPELERIALANRVGGIRSLDKRLVFDAIEADPKHPLRKFYNWNEKEAARSHWLARTGDIIRSVRIIHVQLGKMAVPRPMFLFDPNHAKRGAEEPRRRSSVVTEDVLANDPVYASALSGQIRIIVQALEKLEHVTSMRPTSREVVRLRDAMRAAVDEYLAVMEVAAE